MAMNGNVPASWDEARQLGQLFMMGFDGTAVNEQIKTLISSYFVGSILLTSKNLESVSQATQLILDLQTLARDADHPAPLLIVIDQENGGVNSLYDETNIRQFPSAMAVAGTGDTRLARSIAKATAEELNSCGINWILGPVLNVLTNARNQPLGVRSFGDDPVVVSTFGIEQIRGFREGGVATCGKQFPSSGNLEFFETPTDIPIITDSLENLSQGALVPFRHAITAGVDAVMVGGMAMSSNHINAMHACLSEKICRDLLRTEMQFQGLIISECLEMEALSCNIGISGRTVMAFKAGCDLILTCRSMSVQEEAISGLTAGLENGMIEKIRVQESCARVLALKRKYTSWEKAFSPSGIDNLDRLRKKNTSLSHFAYESTVKVMRDMKHMLPLSKTLLPDDELLLLTPLVKPLPASAAFRQFTEDVQEQSLSARPNFVTEKMVMTGERVFQNFGRLLAKRRSGKVMHASYTANGVRPQHEALLQLAKAVIVITADAGVNKYQAAFAKHVALICRLSEDAEQKLSEKPCLVVAVSSPSDFATDKSIGTYVCSYDFTDSALQAVAKILHEDLKIADTAIEANIKIRRPSQARQQWLVESYCDDRDSAALNALLRAVGSTMKSTSSTLGFATNDTFLLRTDLIEEAHFVVKNSSTKELIGFCATYFHKHNHVGAIGLILVHPSRRHQSVGHSLHDRALQSLLGRHELVELRIGTRLPNVFPGIPTADPSEYHKLAQWFCKLGWQASRSRIIHRLVIPDLSSWEAPDGLGKSLTVQDIKYDLIHGEEFLDSVMEHVRSNAPDDAQALYEFALSNKEGCAIVRARKASDGEIVATVILYRAQSKLAQFTPLVQGAKSLSGGISSAVMTAGLANELILLQGLVLLGVRQLKKQGIQSLLLDYVDDISALPGLQLMGFSTLQSFSEIQSYAEDWSAE